MPNKVLLAALLLTASLFPSELKITGIVLSSENDLELQDPEINGVVIQDLQFASTLQEELAGQFLDQPLTEESLLDVRDAILKSYRSRHHQMVAVHIPEQEISFGKLSYTVCEPIAGQVTFSCNRWFPDRIFRKYLTIRAGETIDEPKILNALSWLNRNPFHHTEVIASPGKRDGVSNIEFITDDRFPLRAVLGVDNTGTIFTDQIRLFAGANWGNAFNVDDLLTVQYSTSPDFHRFMSGFGSYTCFLPWKNTFTLFGAYARIHPKITDFSSSGSDIQASARYGIPFKPLYSNFLNELTLGFDFKAYNNSLFFSESPLAIPIITRKIELTQFYLGYKLNGVSQGDDIEFDLTLKAEVFGSPGRWLTHQTDADYDSLRPNASVQYIYGKLAVGNIYTFAHDWKIAWLARGQLSSGPLLPSEQFALGGYDTVRGYNELDFLADNAICGNLEIRTPEHSVYCKWKDRLFFLIFCDVGWGRNKQVALDLPVHQLLVSAGPGVRYTILPYLNARLDYGFQLHHIFDDHRFGKFHFSVAASY